MQSLFQGLGCRYLVLEIIYQNPIYQRVENLSDSLAVLASMIRWVIVFLSLDLLNFRMVFFLVSLLFLYPLGFSLISWFPMIILILATLQLLVKRLFCLSSSLVKHKPLFIYWDGFLSVLDKWQIVSFSELKKGSVSCQGIENRGLLDLVSLFNVWRQYGIWLDSSCSEDCPSCIRLFQMESLFLIKNNSLFLIALILGRIRVSLSIYLIIITHPPITISIRTNPTQSNAPTTTHDGSFTKPIIICPSLIPIEQFSQSVHLGCIIFIMNIQSQKPYHIFEKEVEYSKHLKRISNIVSNHRMKECQPQSLSFPKSQKHSHFDQSARRISEENQRLASKIISISRRKSVINPTTYLPDKHSRSMEKQRKIALQNAQFVERLISKQSEFSRKKTMKEMIKYERIKRSMKKNRRPVLPHSSETTLDILSAY